MVAVVAGCRFHFDPLDDARGSGTTGLDDAGALVDDGRMLDGTPPVDAFAAACATAIELPLNTLVVGDSCTGFDRIDGCGPAGREEIVYKFTPSVSGSHTFRAYEPTTMNISTSVGRVVTPGCVTTSNCAAIYGTSLTAGVPIYIAVEGGTSACAQFRIQVTNP